MKTTLSPLLWLWLPLVYLALQIGGELTLPHHMMEEFMSESGAIEWIQFAVVVIACAVAVNLLRQISWARQRFLFMWVLLATLGCLFIAGEEISWGQWVFYWDTPTHWAAMNDQNETNLHNISDWLDQKPRTLLEIGVIVGGLILPGFLKFGKTLPDWLAQISPRNTVVVTAALFAFVKLADFVGDYFGLKLFYRPSEVRELLTYYFVLLYLLWLRARPKQLF